MSEEKKNDILGEIMDTEELEAVSGGRGATDRAAAARTITAIPARRLWKREVIAGEMIGAPFYL